MGIGVLEMQQLALILALANNIVLSCHHACLMVHEIKAQKISLETAAELLLLIAIIFISSMLFYIFMVHPEWL